MDNKDRKLDDVLKELDDFASDFSAFLDAQNKPSVESDPLPDSFNEPEAPSGDELPSIDSFFDEVPEEMETITDIINNYEHKEEPTKEVTPSVEDAEVPELLDIEEAPVEEILTEVPVDEPVAEEEQVTEQSVTDIPTEMYVETVEDTPITEPIDVVESQPEEPEATEPVEDTSVEHKTLSKTDWKTILILGLTLCLVLVGVYFFTRPKKEVTLTVTDNGNEVVEEPQMDPDLRELWLSNKAINDDYVGEIIFDNGLLQESFVHTESPYKKDGTPYTFYDKEGHVITDYDMYTGNEVYLWTDWKTGNPVDRTTGIGGSTILDFMNDMSEKLNIIWGHHFARDFMEQNGIEGEPNFTALDKFEDEANYEENKDFKIVLDNEIREYVVCAVYEMNINSDADIEPIVNGAMELNEDNLNHIRSKMFYDTRVEMSVDDSFVMFVTCKQHSPNYRTIVLAKEIERNLY